MKIDKDLWARTGADSLSTRMYTFILGMCLLWSLFLVGVGASITYDMGANFIISLFSFIGAIFGIVIYSRSKSPAPSFVGVSLLSVFMGASVGPILAYYALPSIVTALTYTLVITFFMVVAGVLFPKLIMKVSGFLFVALLILLVGYFAEFIFAIFRLPVIGFRALDWIAVFVFSAYIWYDFARALSLPKTLNNAIDASGALVVDIVNLFVTLLRIFGRRS